ncbi:MAG: aspartate ammonia-lyase [Dehalococcoidia bacterium]|nr:aspartate ammonia-lyase [Dehalococcoidia bacterium]MDD5493917.1 aspartate ammonia-lyase [Dehalococcoidia bacterium]
MAKEKILTGVSGEYFVAAELSKRGYVASITLRNTRGIDILVSNSEASLTVGIQVKTNTGNRKSWILNKKAENYSEKNLFYVFVNLKSTNERPDYYIVPSEDVANRIKIVHNRWLSTPGKRGQQHRDNPMRIFSDKDDKYFEKWELLGL